MEAAGGPSLSLVERPVAASLDELLAGATERTPFLTTDSKSGNPFERVVLGGRPHILKYVHVDDDFTIRVLGDLVPRALRVWASGLMDVAADVIDHTVVGVAARVGRNGWGAAVLMRDAWEDLVRPGDEPLPLDRHLAFLDHLAALAARTWGWRDDVGLTPYGQRWFMFGPGMIEAEEALGFPSEVPQIAAAGWDRFCRQAPGSVRSTVDELRHDPSPLVDALARTPSCFLHGDWKLGNLGSAADGRTVLLDWSYPGEGPVCHDLAWYLAINRARLPHPKEEAIGVLRDALERRGVRTDGWWEAQLELCLLGALVQFGWEKALGDEDELGWWCERAEEGTGRL